MNFKIMREKEFLSWLTDRVVHVYGENPNTDFVRRLREIASGDED